MKAGHGMQRWGIKKGRSRKTSRARSGIYIKRILLVLVTEMICKEGRNQIAIETGSPFPSRPVGPGLSNPFPAIFNI